MPILSSLCHLVKNGNLVFRQKEDTQSSHAFLHKDVIIMYIPGERFMRQRNVRFFCAKRTKSQPYPRPLFNSKMMYSRGELSGNRTLLQVCWGSGLEISRRTWWHWVLCILLYLLWLHMKLHSQWPWACSSPHASFARPFFIKYCGFLNPCPGVPTVRITEAMHGDPVPSVVV